MQEQKVVPLQEVPKKKTSLLAEVSFSQEGQLNGKWLTCTLRHIGGVKPEVLHRCYDRKGFE